MVDLSKIWPENNRYILDEDENEIKFDTYRFYLQCFALVLKESYPTQEDLVKFILAHTKQIRGFPEYDKDWIDRFLKIAWNTEYLVNIDIGDDIELIKINNQWKLIQIYYVLYCLSEAFCYLLDGAKADSHIKCLKKVGNFLSKSLLYPWNLAYHGARGAKRDEHRPVNFPGDLKVDISNLSRGNIRPIDMIGKCLKAEHSNRIDDEFHKKKGEYKYKHDPGYTTLINFLYRLRIKSNYENVDIFLTSPSDTHIRNFSADSKKICLYTTTLLEVLIIKKIGEKNFSHQVEKFCEINKNAKEIVKRNALYEKVII